MKRIDLLLILSVSIAYLLTNEAQGYPKRDLEEKQIQIVVHEIDVNKIRQKDINGLSNYEDEKNLGNSYEFIKDIWIGKHGFIERKRIKRASPLAAAVLAAIKYLKGTILKNFPSVVKKGAKGKTTEILIKRGGYETAKEDFMRFKATDVKEFTGKNGQEGMTGKILDGKYTVTARKTSTHNQLKVDGNVIREGSSTLEIRNNIGDKVTKIRYEDDSMIQDQIHLLTGMPEEGISLLDSRADVLSNLQKDTEGYLWDSLSKRFPDLDKDAIKGKMDSIAIDLPKTELEQELFELEAGDNPDLNIDAGQYLPDFGDIDIPE